MARFTRIEVVLKMKETGIVPVFYNKDIAICKSVLKACYAGGIRVFEFTNRGDYAQQVFEELNRFAEENLPEMILGIGSVTDAATTAMYLQLGANFIVSPALNAEMAKVCNRRKVAWLPGCGSVSEISYAEELGAEVIKIFPADQIGGPQFIKAVKGPLPWVSIMPTGGVLPTEENLTQWFEAGAHCVGIGSALFGKNLHTGGYDEKSIEIETKNAISIVKKLKK